MIGMTAYLSFSLLELSSIVGVAWLTSTEFLKSEIRGHNAQRRWLHGYSFY